MEKNKYTIKYSATYINQFNNLDIDKIILLYKNWEVNKCINL